MDDLISEFMKGPHPINKQIKKLEEKIKDLEVRLAKLEAEEQRRHDYELERTEWNNH